MTRIAIYMEGGGDSASTRAEVRQGMDGLLAAWKQRARDKGWGWKLVPSGSRSETKEAFLNALEQDKDAHVLLLVDAEAPVTEPPTKHLITQDKWSLKDVDESSVHLMIQVMETWLVADPDALEGFYGKGFERGCLPTAANLEAVAKKDIETALKRATGGTKKGEYHKIRHAAVFARVRTDRVRKRCPGHGERFFKVLEGLLGEHP